MKKLKRTHTLFIALFILSVSNSLGQAIQVTSLNSNSICAGTSIGVNFTLDGVWSEGTEFEIQLSDDKGSFTTPVSIGIGLSSPLIGNVPWGTVQSNLYKLRIRALASNKLSQESETIQIKSRPEPPTGRSVYTMCVGDTAYYIIRSRRKFEVV